jgi:hypothetical protein
MMDYDDDDETASTIRVLLQAWAFLKWPESIIYNCSLLERERERESKCNPQSMMSARRQTPDVALLRQ